MPRTERGWSIVELMLSVAIGATVTAIAIPEWARTLDSFRTRAAAGYLAQQVARARTDAIKRSTFVGLRFVPGPDDYAFTVVVDGNGNGLRTADITAGIDAELSAPDRLGWHFTGVRFGLAAGTPDASMQTSASTDGVRIGSSTLLSMNPNGSSSGGTLYVLGERGTQYAVRVLGATGRVRILKFDPHQNTWMEQ